MKKSLGLGLGVAAGTALYDRFISEAQAFDATHAVFIGVFCAVGYGIAQGIKAIVKKA